MRRRRLASLFAAGLILLSLAAAAPATAKGHLNVLLDGPELAQGHHRRTEVGLRQPGLGRAARSRCSSTSGPAATAARPARRPTRSASRHHRYRRRRRLGHRDRRGPLPAGSPGAAPEAVFDILAYQAVDIDPTDQDFPPNPGESNPNGLTALGFEDVLIADAAGNDLLRVTPEGDAVTVARWPVEIVPNTIPGLPRRCPLRPCRPR